MFGKIERIHVSATIAGVGDPVFPTALRILKRLSFKLHGSGVEKSWKLQFVEQWQDSVYTFIRICLVNG